MITNSQITGRFLSALVDSVEDNTTPLSGFATFKPSVQTVITKVDGVDTILALPTVTVALDGDGDISSEGLKGVLLVATDNTALNPSGFTYNVSFSLSYKGRSVKYPAFDIEAPQNTVVDLSVVAPVTSSNGVAITRGEPGPAGTGIEILGSVATFTELPSTGNTVGATYIVEDTNQLHLWDGDSWSTGFDLRGETGATGQSAYDLAVAQGFVGSLNDWLLSLKGESGNDGLDGQNGSDGQSAYDLAVAQGFVGTQADYLASLKGEKGNIGTSTRIVGVTATTIAAGTNAGVLTGGTELERTIQFMIPRGNTGSQGPAGTNATITGVSATGLPAGQAPTVSMGGTSSARTFAFGIPAGQPGQDGNDGLPGADGASAYEVAVANGFVGTEAQWLESLKGADGTSGEGASYDDTALSGRVSTLETAVNTDIPATYATKAELPAEYDDTALAGRVTTVENALPNKLDASTASTTYATKTELSDGLATKINSSTVSSNYLSKADAATTYATKADEEARPRIYTGATAPANPRAGDIWVQ